MSASTRFFWFLCDRLLIWVAHVSSLRLTCLCLSWSLGIWGNTQNHQYRPNGKIPKIKMKFPNHFTQSVTGDKSSHHLLKKAISDKTNLGSEDRISGWLTWATSGCFRAAVLFNAFWSCAGGSWKTKDTPLKAFSRDFKSQNLHPWKENTLLNQKRKALKDIEVYKK